MTVFSLWSADFPGTEIDLFVSEPFPFEGAWPRRLRADLGGLAVNVAGLADLIAMKRRAGRPRDLEDVHAERLRWLEQAKRFASRALDAARKRGGRSSDAGSH